MWVQPNGSMHSDTPVSACGWCSLTRLAHNALSSRHSLSLWPARAECGAPMFGIPSDMSKDGACRPSAVKNKGHLASTVWTGWTTSWAALPAAAAESRIFCSSHFTQITDSESLFMALQALTGKCFAPGSPWRARAVRASTDPAVILSHLHTSR